MKTLETDRLILRAFREEDAADVYAYAQSPNVGPAAGWPPHDSLEASQRIVRMFIEQDDAWAIVLKETGRVIGSFGLHKNGVRRLEAHKSIGYVLGEAYWGHGFMPEAVREVLRYAFEEEHLLVVSVVHYPFNEKSKRVIEKCGFTYEGTLRMATQSYSGAIYDDVCYSMTRDEYETLYKRG